MTTGIKNRKEATSEMSIIKKTYRHPYVDKNPAKKGPTAPPIDPVPSIMAVTVARASLFCILVPRSADTAVVINAYGPLIIIPNSNCSVHRVNNE